MRPAWIVVVALLLAGCAENEGVSSSGLELVGGAKSDDPRIDAVGVTLNPNGTTCTGTLIAPSLVLTAKHCIAEGSTAPELRFGADSNRPTRTVPIEGAYTCSLDEGGASGLGCDVAIYRLSRPVTDVAPLAVSVGAPMPSLVGASALAVGYGLEDPARPISGRRKSGALTIRAVGGRPWQLAFPTFESYASAAAKEETPQWARENEPLLRMIYDYTLLDGYEAFAGGGAGEAQTCPGDSGGPLLVEEGGALVVYGVVSSGTGGPRAACHRFGGVFATFGPAAQTMLARARADAE